MTNGMTNIILNVWALNNKNIESLSLVTSHLGKAHRKTTGDTQL